MCIHRNLQIGLWRNNLTSRPISKKYPSTILAISITREQLGEGPPFTVSLCTPATIDWARHNTTVADPGVGDRGAWSPPPPLWTCPDPENLCKVCVTGTDPPPPLGLECWWRHTGHTGNAQGGGGCLWMSKRGGLSICRRVDDVTQAMSKGGACECSFTPPPSVGWMTSRRQYPIGGGCLWMFFHPPTPRQEILYPRLY